MTQKSIWEKRWQKKAEDVIKSTSLDFFAAEAFQVLDQYINEDIQKNEKVQKILEVGSGTGRFCLALAEKYPQKSIKGIDYTDESIALSQKGVELKELKNVQFEKADLFQLPYPDNSFDLVFENGVIEHFTNYPEAIQEMKRVTKTRGLIIVNVNNWYCFPKTLEKKILGRHYPFGYEKSFKHQEVRGALEEADLREIEVYAYNPANYVVRFFFFNKHLKKLLGKGMKRLEQGIDFISGKRFSRRFGYMIFGVGRK